MGEIVENGIFLVEMDFPLESRNNLNTPEPAAKGIDELFLAKTDCPVHIIHGHLPEFFRHGPGAVVSIVPNIETIDERRTVRLFPLEGCNHPVSYGPLPVSRFYFVVVLFAHWIFRFLFRVLIFSSRW